MLGEIMDMNDKIEFIEAEYKGHYIRTPYTYQLEIGRKYTPRFHVDLGQGLIQLVDEIYKKTKRNENSTIQKR